MSFMANIHQPGSCRPLITCTLLTSVASPTRSLLTHQRLWRPWWLISWIILSFWFQVMRLWQFCFFVGHRSDVLALSRFLSPWSWCGSVWVPLFSHSLLTSDIWALSSVPPVQLTTEHLHSDTVVPTESQEEKVFQILGWNSWSPYLLLLYPPRLTWWWLFLWSSGHKTAKLILDPLGYSQISKSCLCNLQIHLVEVRSWFFYPTPCSQK